MCASMCVVALELALFIPQTPTSLLSQRAVQA